LVLADACYSGFFGRRGELMDRADIRQLVMQPSRIAITAGTEGQAAFEDGKLGHGLFTAALLESLMTRRALTASELFVVVRMAVAKSSGNQMLPQMREMAVGNGEFVFIPKSLESEQVENALTQINQKLLQRVSKATTAQEVVKAFEAPLYQYSIAPQ
jgi:uncharacterized caspase-like protein